MLLLSAEGIVLHPDDHNSEGVLGSWNSFVVANMVHTSLKTGDGTGAHKNMQFIWGGQFSCKWQQNELIISVQTAFNVLVNRLINLLRFLLKYCMQIHCIARVRFFSSMNYEHLSLYVLKLALNILSVLCQLQLMHCLHSIMQEK